MTNKRMTVRQRDFIYSLLNELSIEPRWRSIELARLLQKDYNSLPICLGDWFNCYNGLSQYEAHKTIQALLREQKRLIEVNRDARSLPTNARRI